MNTLSKSVRSYSRVARRLAKYVTLRRAIALSVAAVGLVHGQTARAATYYWDANDGTAGFGGAAGTWTATTSGTTSRGWSLDSTGATVVNGNSVTTLNTDSLTDALNFGTATDGLATSTITVSGTVASGNITFGSASGTITLSGGTIDLGASAPTITVNNATNTISSIITGNAGFTKAGTGVLFLGGANTYTGGTILNAGQLDINNNSALGTGGLTINAGTTINPRSSSRNLANNVTVLGSFAIGGPAANGNGMTLSGTIDLGGGTRTITVNNSGNASFTNIVSNGALTKAGLSTLLLSGANTYAGGTIINAGAGSIAISNNSALGTGDVGIGTDSASGAAARLQLSGGITVANAINVAGIAPSTTAANARIENVSGSNTLTGNINFAQLGDVSTTIISTAGSLALNGNMTAVAPITGPARFYFAGAGATSVGGIISNGTAQSVGITKDGSGTLTLAGANTFTGVTMITAGTLSVGTIGNGGVASSNLGSATNAAANLVLGGGTLQYTGATASTDRNFTLLDATSSGINVSTSTTNLTITGASTTSTGALTKSGAGTLTLTSANLYSGGTTIANNGGTIAISNGSALGTGLISVAMGGGTNAAGKLQLSGNITLANNMNFGGSTTTTNVRLESLSGNNIVNGNITFANTGGSINNIVTTAGLLTLNGNITTTVTTGPRSFNFGGAGATTVTGIISDGLTPTVVAVSKEGTGTLTLSGANTYTGVTTLTAGTLSVSTIGNGGVVSGNLGSATNAATNLVLGGGTLQYTGVTASTDRNFTLTAATTSSIDVTASTTNLTIAGASTATTGGLTKVGAGTLTLASSNAYTGNTTVSAGTLALASTGSIANSAKILVESGATFDVQAVSGYTVATAQTLGGTGTVLGNVALAGGAKLSPGSSPGTLTFANNLNLSAIGSSNSGDLLFELGTVSDLVLLSGGSLSIGTGTLGFNDFVFSDLAGFGPGTYTLFQTNSLINGTLDASDLTGTVGGISATLGFANGGNNLVLNVAAIPEPSTLVIGSLCGLGLAIHGMRRRRCRG